MRGFARFLSLSILSLALFMSPARAQTEPALSFAGTQTPAKENYICPMHPHIQGRAGDKCPICGMDLVPAPSTPNPQARASEENKKETDRKAQAGQGAFLIDPAYVQALGVRTAPVLFRTFGETIRAFGRVVPITRNEYSVALRTSGLIRDLMVESVGSRVEKGDLLFTFYSPELVVAQQDYLSRTATGSHRLRMLGMDDGAIAQLDRTKKVLYETPFHAPASGIVARLDGRKGQSVADGMTVLEIHDLSHVWIEAALSQKDLTRLKAGLQARVEELGGTRLRMGRIEIVASELDEVTRTGAAKVLLENADGALRPGEYVDIVFQDPATARLSVPDESVLYGGQGARVVKVLGDGAFEVVPVRTGLTGDGYTEILSGLSEDDTVVASGQFLIDAESTLRGGTDRMVGPGEGRKDAPANGGGHVH